MIANRVLKVLNVRPGEGGLVLVLGMLLLLNSMALQVSGIVGISGFLSAGGVNNFLIVLLVDYLLVLLTAGLQTFIVDRFDRISLMKWMTFAFALIFIILRLMFTFGAPAWFNYSLIYLIAEQQWLYFPLLFWILANDIFDMPQTTRLFPLIASWGFIGKVIGIGIAAASPTLLRNAGVAMQEVLSLNVLLYLLAYMLIAGGLGSIKIEHTPRKPETMRETLTEGWAFVKEVPSFRFLTVAILCLAIADTIIEFRFLVISNAHFRDLASYQQFYSLYRLIVTVAAFFMQMLLTGRLIGKLGLKNTFLFFPIVAFIGAAGLLVLPGIATAIGAMALVKLNRDTIDESSRKSFQALVPVERRGRVSMFMDSYLPAIGTILGCLIAGTIVLIGLRLGSEQYPFFYMVAAATASTIALIAVLRMRTVYDSSLLNWRLKRRRRNTQILEKLEF